MPKIAPSRARGQSLWFVLLPLLCFFISVRPYYDHNMIMAIIGLKTLFSRNVNEIVVNKELGN